ncbi:hypothetical protein D3C73_728550 [compost metagenome]
MDFFHNIILFRINDNCAKLSRLLLTFGGQLNSIDFGCAGSFQCFNNKQADWTGAEYYSFIANFEFALTDRMKRNCGRLYQCALLIGDIIRNFVDHIFFGSYVFGETTAAPSQTKEAHCGAKVIVTCFAGITFTAGIDGFNNDPITHIHFGYTVTNFYDFPGKLMSHNDWRLFSRDWMRCALWNEDWSCCIFMQVAAANAAPFDFNFNFTW